MNKDIVDICKILELLQTDNLEEIEYSDDEIWGKICEGTRDVSRREKHILNKERCFSQVYPNLVNPIKQTCKKEDCYRCPINKLCNKYRNKQQNFENFRKAPTYADFFCGAGGMSLGFYRAGFKMSLANDIEQVCAETISLNHPEVPERHIIAGDINNVLEHIEELSRYKNVDVVIGGPPCQGFSMANRQRIIDDPRNHLYKSFIEAIDILKPKFVVMENVRGILKVKEDIIDNFNQIGYSASAKILNAKDFGVPQNRERVIFIANRIDKNNDKIFEKIIRKGNSNGKAVLYDAIENLPILQAKTIPNATEYEEKKSGFTIAKNDMRTNSYADRLNRGKVISVLYNHKARYNNDRDIEIFSRLNPGDNSADEKISDIMPYTRRNKIFKDKYFKLEPNKVCKTITAHMKFDCNMYIHPNQARGLTPREAARVQSFPDDYYFRGSYTKTYMQVGNSVPPLLAEAIAKVIKEEL